VTKKAPEDSRTIYVRVNVELREYLEEVSNKNQWSMATTVANIIEHHRRCEHKVKLVTEI